MRRVQSAFLGSEAPLAWMVPPANLCAISRVLARLKSTILRLNVTAADEVGEHASEGCCLELRGAGLDNKFGYSPIIAECAASAVVVYKAEEVVYILDEDAIVSIWKQDGSVLSDDHSEQSIIGATHLSRRFRGYLRGEVWSSWFTSSDGQEFLTELAHVEEVSGDSHPFDDIVDMASLLSSDGDRTVALKLPRPQRLQPVTPQCHHCCDVRIMRDACRLSLLA